MSGYNNVKNTFNKGDVLVCISNIECIHDDGDKLIHDDLVIGEKYIASDDSYFFFWKEFVPIQNVYQPVHVSLFIPLSEYRKNKIDNILNE